MLHDERRQMVDRVAAFIKANIEKRILVSELAAEVHMSRHHFSRVFKAQTGMTPQQGIIAARIMCARCMLTRGGAALAIVAFSCGFSSQAHMTRAFKAATGMTPSAYYRVNQKTG